MYRSGQRYVHNCHAHLRFSPLISPEYFVPREVEEGEAANKRRMLNPTKQDWEEDPK